jgi:hypothetical protein
MRALIGIIIALGAGALFLGAGGPELKGHIGLLAAAIGGVAIAWRGLVGSSSS